MSLISMRVPANVALAAPKAIKVAIAISFCISAIPYPAILVRGLANVNLLSERRRSRTRSHMATAEYLQFMADAIGEDRGGEAEGEVPVGAIAVADGQIVGAGHNQPI